MQFWIRKFYAELLSASSWGCELKCKKIGRWISDDFVSLFVRLWVEMTLLIAFWENAESASSWGCELKYVCYSYSYSKRSQPLREAVSWNTGIPVMGVIAEIVSLFVRLWVEIVQKGTSMWLHRQPLREAVSWNRIGNCTYILDRSQPLREAVSWNLNLCVLQEVQV